MTSSTMCDPQSSNMLHMVNYVSTPSFVSSNDFMVILDSVFLFGLTVYLFIIITNYVVNTYFI